MGNEIGKANADWLGYGLNHRGVKLTSCAESLPGWVICPGGTSWSTRMQGLKDTSNISLRFYNSGAIYKSNWGG